ncbi:uncharacterized protein LOC122641516 [Telopea speciosissima]|uniref:uncharacterized protein LOC122641516 n=1 Tax=Telopea speciosissima TaxID=54955 RepID=UPI001CC48636|nr:uncharacterized protein LOC122641516 [Telopea speciosissima]XP_043690709.1 uncharacterized protein LOC122641516 [Telopea speciosissima]XP_043690710.1 uncharacterized protein LOC122641516 [Telopea speciosissima]
MVFSSVLVLAVANLSADVCQYIACNPERLSSQQVLELVCCIPLQQLGRLALCLWTFFCLPPPDSYYRYSSDDSDSSGSDLDSDDSHSD